ncbi:uncharacterized protein LOC109543517 [Dendroctonus ponderosae]|uniref:uncharacterized protein LOC109543517 n=1 Tax=Dendroctonus ponderosae TaxID=77166 RepID=UPI002034C794|nr:uncharacterized protein LOC109543517 [Dendroctonus ponderosae]
MSISAKERHLSATRKKSRRYTHDVLRATIESETDDCKRLPYLLHKQCEERNAPAYPEVHAYMIKEDGQVVLVDNAPTIRKSIIPLDSNLVIYAYSNLNLKLRALDFRCFRIMDPRLFFAIIQTMPHFPDLFSLQLDYCNLTSEHILILKQHLSRQKTLSELNLTGNPHGHRSFHRLLRCGLKVLILKFCNIAEKGLRKMASEYLNHPYEPPGLLHLDLSHNPVFDEGCKYIASILKCDRTLRSLNLTDCKIRDSGLELIALSFRTFALSDDEICVRRKIRLDYFRLLQETPFSDEPNATKPEATLANPKDSFSLVETTVKIHPFVNETVQENGEILVKGNCTLEHLNISYNQLSKSSLDLLLKTVMEQAGTLEALQQLVLEGNCRNDPECDSLKITIQEWLAGRKTRSRSLPGSVKSKSSLKRRRSSGATSTTSGLSSRDKHSSIHA